MILRRYLAVFAVVALTSGSSAIACSGTIISADGGVDASTDRTSLDRVAHDARDTHDAHDAHDDARDARDAHDDGSDASCVDGGATPVLTELRVAAASTDASRPFPLVPSFSPDVHDYYVRCDKTNELSVTIAPSCGAVGLLSQPTPYSASPRRQTRTVSVNANQAVVAVAESGTTRVEYWVRCLPPDFPNLQWEAFPEAGVPAPGYYLLGNFQSAGASGSYAMVLNGDGVPVWYYRELTGAVADVDDLVDGGLTYFPVVGGPLRVVALSPFGDGGVGVTKAAPNGLPLDYHELRALSNGHYLVITNPNLAGVDLTGLSLPTADGGEIPLGPGSNVSECEIVEFDPSDGAVIWTWKASDHFDPAKVCTEPERWAPLSDGGPVIDTFHCNSIDVDPTNGNLLVSARQMDSAFYIDRASGKVLWKMGGAPDSLDDAGYVAVADPFFEQHDVRMQPGWSACTGGQISLFDDESRRPGPARAVVYDVALGSGACDGGAEAGAGTATLTWQYKGSSTSVACGSHRIAADGSRIIGWGLQPDNVLTELDAKGQPMVVLHSSYAPSILPMESYRAIKVPTSTYDLGLLRATAGR